MNFTVQSVIRHGLLRRELVVTGCAALSSAWSSWHARAMCTAARQGKAVYVASADNKPTRHTPFLIGLINYFERHLPYVGFFTPVAGAPLPGSNSGVDRHAELVHKAFDWKIGTNFMVGVSEDEATKLIASGRLNDVLDKVYGNYATYREAHDLIVVEGTGVGGLELDAQLAAALNAPVIMTMDASQHRNAADIYGQMMMKRQLFVDHNVDVLAVTVDRVSPRDHAILASQLRKRFADSGVAFAGAVPIDPVLDSVRLDEVQAALGAELLYGGSGRHDAQVDGEFDEVVVASQRLEELLEQLQENRHKRPLVVTSQDRLDLVLGLLASQASLTGPAVAGVLLAQAGYSRTARNYSRTIAEHIFEGFQRRLHEAGNGAAPALPVLSTNLSLFSALQEINSLSATILPTSQRKIQQAKNVFDANIDVNLLVTGLEKPQEVTMTPKMFTFNIRKRCQATPQHIVLPEGLDKRVLAAAADLVARGMARITLLGNADLVASQAKALGLDISGCQVIDPRTSPRCSAYVDFLLDARKKKALTRDSATEQVVNDVNTFGCLMVATGDADGMVSGAIHTTAATIRPALQLLRKPGGLVSSVFFMCLPDKVLVYGDCAVNVTPTSDDLAQIASTSADTARAFGVEPRVAMLSYSTLGSGAGPDVQKVVDAVALVKSSRPDLAVEGPIQYDAAIDPAVAAVKVKTSSEVAGKATVFVFPDLNTGNNTYKAVQQATHAIAMGPVMQGLLKPVNDLSRGCTVVDIVNTVCVTSIQAMDAKAK